MLGARRTERIQSLANELTACGGKAIAIATDVTYCGQAKRLVDAAVQTYGRIVNGGEKMYRRGGEKVFQGGMKKGAFSSLFQG